MIQKRVLLKRTTCITIKLLRNNFCVLLRLCVFRGVLHFIFMLHHCIPSLYHKWPVICLKLFLHSHLSITTQRQFWLNFCSKILAFLPSKWVKYVCLNCIKLFYVCIRSFCYDLNLFMYFIMPYQLPHIYLYSTVEFF